MLHSKYNPAKVGVLDELRQDGYKVFVSHKRVLADSIYEGEHVRDFTPDDPSVFVTRHEIIKKGYNWSEVSPTGGVTTVSLYDAEDTLRGEGISYCCLNDAFNKRRGLTVALGRALKSVE